MKKHYIIIGVTGAVLLVAGFIFFSSGSASRGVQKVVSDDGLAELEIPKNSLPEGVSIKDISVTNVSVGDAMIAYELKPNGTKFSKSLTFKTTFKNKENVIPIPLMLSEDNGFEVVNDSETTLNITKNETTISVPIGHFSILVLPTSSDRAFFNATMHLPDQLYIGDVVTAKATLNKNVGSVVLFSELNPWAVPLYDDENRTILGRHSLGYRVVANSVKVSGKVFAYLAVGPGKYVYGYPESSMFIGESLSIKSTDYTCEKLGTGAVTFTFDLEYDAEAVDVISGGQSGQTLRVGSSVGLKRYNKKGHGTAHTYEELECVARPTVQNNSGGGVQESESRAIEEILNGDENRAPSTTKSPAKIKVCGLPGGPACPQPR